MRQSTIDSLVQQQSKNKFCLLISLLLFCISLFALVSRWPICYLLITLSCLFYLVTRHIGQKRYTSVFVEALMEHAVEQDAEIISFSTAEQADGFLFKKGFMPDISLVSGSKHHHVLHGKMNNLSFSIGETAFVRKQSNNALHSVSGTFITVEDLLPAEETWLICKGSPFKGLCSDSEYEQAGYIQPAPPKNNLSIWQCASASSMLDVCEGAFSQMQKSGSAALAARAGSLSLFLPGAFFAPEKIDSSKEFTPDMLKGFQIPAFNMMKTLVRAVAASK